MKRCSKCKEVQSLDHFHRSSTSPDGAQRYCKSCTSTYSKARLLATQYGITLLMLNGMLYAQGNKCAICNRPFNDALPFVVDHCHSSFKVRSLLCHACNLGLGHMADDPLRMRQAADYIERHKSRIGSVTTSESDTSVIA